MLAVAKVAVLVYAGLCLAVYLGHRRLVFPGGRVMDRTPATPPFRWDYDDLYLPVGSHMTNAWYIPLENARGVVLFSHGNGGTMSDRLETVELYRALGFSMLVYDYGGYGKSTGNATEARCYDDIRAMWHYLTRQRNIPPNRIVLFGRSLGAGVTAQLATEVNPVAVILDSTFLSIPALARDKLPILPMKWIIRHRFDNARKVPRIHAPILIVHSPDDTLIPYRHGRALFDLANEPRQFFATRGDHNDGFMRCAGEYAQSLAEFFAAAG